MVFIKHFSTLSIKAHSPIHTSTFPNSKFSKCLQKNNNDNKTLLKHCGNLNKCTDILTGPSDSDSMASSHSFLFSLSFLMSAFCSWDSLYISTLTFLGVLAGGVFEDSKRNKDIFH